MQYPLLMAREPWRGRGGTSKVFRSIVNLEPGQILLNYTEDWRTQKYPHTQVVRYITKKYNRRYEVLCHAGGKGWAVERIA